MEKCVYVAPKLVAYGRLGTLTGGWDAVDYNDGQGGANGKRNERKDGLGTDDGGHTRNSGYSAPTTGG